MYGKLLIQFDIQLLTGMHIGGSSAFSAIGAVDSPVVRDSYSGLPVLPGSSLKGKLRYLLAKATTSHYIPPKCEDEPVELTRLFGTAGNRRSRQDAKTARLQFSDASMTNADDLRSKSGVTEVKFENTINRITAVANPRQIERVIRSANFSVKLVYDVEEENEALADMKTLAHGLKLLSMDYLGGHGTRGYGKIKCCNFAVEDVEGSFGSLCAEAQAALKEVEQYAVFAG